MRELHECFPNSTIQIGEKLDGLTNQNYLIIVDDTNKYVYRKAGSDTHLFINREYEKNNSEKMAEIGVYMGDAYFNSQTGTKVVKYIENAHYLDNTEEQLEQVAAIFRRIHTSNQTFNNIFNYFKELKKYEQLCHKQSIVPFTGYEAVASFIMGTKPMYERYLLEATCCHNDPLRENFIFGYDEKIYLLDWEYSGMNDCYWDLAGYILENELNEQQAASFVQAYATPDKLDEAHKRINLYKIYQDFIWHKWGLVKSESDPSFKTYAQFRFNRCLKMLSVYTGGLQ